MNIGSERTERPHDTNINRTFLTSYLTTPNCLLHVQFKGRYRERNGTDKVHVIGDDNWYGTKYTVTISIISGRNGTNEYREGMDIVLVIKDDNWYATKYIQYFSNDINNQRRKRNKYYVSDETQKIESNEWNKTKHERLNRSIEWVKRNETRTIESKHRMSETKRNTNDWIEASNEWNETKHERLNRKTSIIQQLRDQRMIKLAMITTMLWLEDDMIRQYWKYCRKN